MTDRRKGVDMRPTVDDEINAAWGEVNKARAEADRLRVENERLREDKIRLRGLLAEAYWAMSAEAKLGGLARRIDAEVFTSALVSDEQRPPVTCETCLDEGVILVPDPREAPTYESGPEAAERPCPDCAGASPRTERPEEDR